MEWNEAYFDLLYNKIGITYFESKYFLVFLNFFYKILSETSKQYTFKESAHIDLPNGVIS